jgi:glycosyltransferase involved in cell wall biosynthesis
MSVTIAIPFYNAEECLPDAIRCVFAQTHQDWELILIDDGSSDNSLQIAKAVQDSRIRVVSDGQNKKLAARLNQVNRLAKYDYILRMDADDLMSPNRLELQLKILQENPHVDILSTGVCSILNDFTLVGTRGQDFDKANFEDILSKKKGIVHASILGKKEWFVKHQYDESLSIAQDTELWLRTLKKNELVAKSIKEPLYFYREEYNITQNKILRAYRNERIILKKYATKKLPFILLKSHMKSLFVKVLAFFNLIHTLQKRRNPQPPSEERVRKFHNDLRIIMNTPVEGLDNR